jgi:hypothetical protein
MGPDVKLLWIPGDLHVLFAQAPSEVKSQVPEAARRVVLSFGILPAPEEARGRADGVTFKVIGITAKGEERRLLQRHIPAMFADQPSDVRTETLELHDPRVQQLRLIIRAGELSDWDWSYWSGIEFQE